MAGQFRGTYVSENALLPHQASTHFRESEWHIVRGFRSEIRDFKDLPERERNARLMGLFDEIGLKSASHDWQTSTTEGSQNVYSILHAPRGSHNEAIVLVAPWTNMDGEFNDGGMALLVSLARYLKKWSIWHKNLIFVVPSNPHSALRAWVGAYHTSLKYTAGSVEGAVVLDFASTSERFDHVEVYYDGLNGQLPNLDLINTLVKVADAEYVRCDLPGSGPSYHLYGQRLQTMAAGIFRQIVAGIKPGAGCEMFSGWRIDAITLRAVGSDGETGHDITTFGRLVESVVRSINNLLEHFHQSFFFYLLLGPRFFVSIGTYLPCAMLVSNSFLIMAIHIFASKRRSFSRETIGLTSMTLGAVGLASLMLSSFFVNAISSTTWRLGLFAAATSGCISARKLLGNDTKQAIYGTALTLYGFSLTTLSMFNFSLAFGLGFITIPLAWLRRVKFARSLIILLTCPVTVLGIAAWVMDIPLLDLIDSLIYAHKVLSVWTWQVITQIWLPMWFVGVIIY
ncbi:GPI transamidase component GAA1 [Wickerhamiella sorbophila]|uniref:GPI transamidase component GAA1 n=1 Tax=Wickerhamiella sorbophila TaxID=45607 RepID=A0A2T0FJ00_9ASCO|nr:GPI transamidase component GAA1 [Wickerhamiella sorbophila]PRT54968.1 GPI transamidase component GAA1 [Wickerhamiella sorbophila]